jgi:hypothetical protein
LIRLIPGVCLRRMSADQQSAGEHEFRQAMIECKLVVGHITSDGAETLRWKVKARHAAVLLLSFYCSIR